MRRGHKRVSVAIVCFTLITVVLFGGPSQWLDRHLYGIIDQSAVDINGNDVIVALHIPRTGMTSLSTLFLQEAVVDKPCTCHDQMTKCKCVNKHGQPWFFHSFNTTGFVCGEYADFTTLNNCPIDYWFRTSGRDTRLFRRYFLVTMLREPTTRYVSEWLHTRNEDTFFKNEPRLFRNTSLELQKKSLACYLGIKLSNLQLLDFINCKENPAHNRQTRMLANLAEVNALGLSGQAYDEALLESAQQTLLGLPFFGILDRLDDTMALLEAELGFHFRQPLQPRPMASETVLPLEPGILQQVREVNHLDIKLFQFANKLFDKKLSTKLVDESPPNDNLKFDTNQFESGIHGNDLSDTSGNMKIGRRKKRNIPNVETLNENDEQIGRREQDDSPQRQSSREAAASDNKDKKDAAVVDEFLATLEQLKKEKLALANDLQPGQHAASGNYGRSLNKPLNFKPEDGRPDHDSLYSGNTRVRRRSQGEKDVDRMFM